MNNNDHGNNVRASENQPIGDDVDTEVIGKEALQQLLPVLQGFKPEELLQVNLDIPGAVVMVLGSLPEIRFCVEVGAAWHSNHC